MMAVVLRLVLALAAVLSGPRAAVGQERPYDLLIVGGHVIDGSGDPSFQADVAIRGSRIAAVGPLAGAAARRVIDAGGQVVVPGFIDLHSHADDARPGGLRSPDPRRRAAPNLVTQGVTTVVVNQDGRSPWPISAQRLFLEERGIGPNAVLLVGHGTVRARAMRGSADRPATAAEVRTMRRLVRQALDEGAAGLSAGLEYEPGRWSTTDELVEVVGEVAGRGGVFMVHQRSEGGDPLWYLPSGADQAWPCLLDAVRETIEIGERTGVTVVVSHIKSRGVDHWGTSGQVIGLIDDARRRGVSVYADVHPYTTSGTDTDVRLVPDRASALVRAVGLPDTVDSAIRADIAHEIRRRGGADRLVIVDSPGDRYTGRTLGELAAARGVDPVDMAIRLQLEGESRLRGGVRIMGASMTEEDVGAYARQPWAAIASDAGIALPTDGAVHPRLYGTFPRALRSAVQGDDALSLEAAVRSMTSLPATILGLADRGLVRPGFAADLVILDPAGVADTATHADPHRYARGIAHVLVGGRAVVAHGQPTWALPGQVLSPAITPGPRAQ
jgi:N-acyl-D-amino-acid deacylase